MPGVIRPQFRREAPAAAPPRLKTTYLQDIVGEEESKIDWMVAGLIPRGFVTMLAGPPTVGKSFLMKMLQIASWSATAKWFGLDIEAHVHSYGFYSEDLEKKIVRPRFHRICAEYGVDPFDVDNGAVSWDAEPDDGSPFNPLLFTSEGGTTPLWQQIAGPAGQCVQLRCGLLIIDNASTVLDIHDSTTIYAFCTLLKRFAAQHNIAIVLLHHPPKAMTAFYSGPAWEKTLRHMLSLERPKTYDPYTGEDADKLLLRVASSNLPCAKTMIHMQWRDGMLELADAPPSLRQRFPLSTSEKADLDLRVLGALRYELGRGHRVLSDPTKAESLYARLRKSASWQHVAPGDLEGSIDRLIGRGQIVVEKEKQPATLEPAT